MMTVHKLSAGDGYTYLTRQVSSGDMARARGQALSDYYVVDGNPPGVWLGGGATTLGISGMVTEQQMKALFGEGRHPDADAIERRMIAEGASPAEAVQESLLGRRFPIFKEAEDDGWREAIASAYAQFRTDHGRDPEAGIERDVVRWSVAGTLLGPSASDRDRMVFLATRGASKKQAVAGYDLVFTPVKSVSVLWALGDEETHRSVRDAHEAAWRQTMAWVEKEAALTRVGAGGIAQYDTTGLVATAFTHHDSRAGDPNLHTHVAVANKVMGVDGKWRSLDARVLHSLAVAASERYNSAVETEVSARLGVVFEDVSRGRGKQPVREIRGISQDVIEEFSSRRQAIESAYGDLLDVYRATHGHEPDKATQLRLMQQATLDTRSAKEEPKKLTEQRAVWQGQAATVLGEDDTVEAMVARALNPPLINADDPMVMEVGDRLVDLRELETVAELGDLAVELVSENRSTWTRWNVEAAAQRIARVKLGGAPSAGAIDELAEAVVAQAEQYSVVRIDAPDLNPVPFVMQRRSGASIYRVHGGQRRTSTAIIAAENALVDAARTPGGLTVSAGHFAVAMADLARERELNAGQRELARRFATGGHRIEVGIGPAGSGKTSSMKVFVRAVNLAGGRVLALGPSAAAAEVLGADLGVGADTVHKLLHVHATMAPDQIPPAFHIDDKTILLVDEAGMAGTPRLARLLALAEQYGASVRLLGDPAQLSAIEAGGALRLITNKVGAAELTEVHRFTHDRATEEAAASLAIRDGDTSGLDFYVEAARVSAGSQQDHLEQIYAGWFSDVEAGLTSLMIAGSNTDVAALNSRARMDRIAAGLAATEGVLLHDGTQAGIGDLVVTRSNDRRLSPGGDYRGDWVRNGHRWMVTDRFDDGSIRVKHQAGKHVVDLPASYVNEHVELAYAATVNRVQGMTVDTAHALVEPGMTRDQFYVSMTRARLSNRAYVVTEDLLDLDLHHDVDPQQAARQVLLGVVSHESAELSATETIERELEEAKSLARLAPQYVDAFTRVLDPERAQRVSAQVEAFFADTPEVGAQLISDDAYPVLLERLVDHEARGADVGDLLAAVVGPRDIDTHSPIESLAKVLHYRIGAAEQDDDATGVLPPWLVAPPSLEAYTRATTDLNNDQVRPDPITSGGEVDDEADGEVDDEQTLRLKSVMDMAWTYWSDQAPNSWVPDYLTSRGLDSSAAGYAPAGWDNLVTHLRSRGVSDDEIMAAGLATVSRRGTLIDRFRDRLVFPVIDAQDHVVAATARANPSVTDADIPKYINSPETEIFHKSQTLYGLDSKADAALRAGAKAVLVEGAMDLAAVATLNTGFVPLAAGGTAITTEHLDKLRDLMPDGLDGLVLALDGDKAGRKATVRLAAMLTPEEASSVRVLRLDPGVDPADMVKDHRADELTAALKAPVPFSHALVDAALANWNIDSGEVEPRVNALREAIASISNLTDAAFLEASAYLTAQMGDRLGLDTIMGEILDARAVGFATRGTNTTVVEEKVTAVAADLTAPHNPEVAAWLIKQAELIAARVDHLVDEAVAGRSEWLTILGPCPTNPRAALAWTQAARTLVAYRDQYQITGRAPLGDDVTRGTQSDHRKAAQKAVDTMARIAATERARAAIKTRPLATEGPSRAQRLREMLGTATEQTPRSQTAERLHDLLENPNRPHEAHDGDNPRERQRGPQV